MHGVAQMTVSGDGGDEVLSGRRVSTWVDRIIDAPFVRIVAGPAGKAPAPLDEGFDLEGRDVQVVDRGSANGTFVARPKETTWLQIGADEPVTITPATRVRLGEHVFLFDSHHKTSG